MPYRFNPLSGNLDYYETSSDKLPLSGGTMTGTLVGNSIVGNRNIEIAGADADNGVSGYVALYGGIGQTPSAYGGDCILSPGSGDLGDGKVKIQDATTGNNWVADVSGLTDDRIIALPDKAGTLATMADVIAYSSAAYDPVDSAAPYYGLMDILGNWEIRYSTVSGCTYAGSANNGAITDYADAWANRLTLTYGTPEEAH